MSGPELRPQPEGIPLPTPSVVSAPFWEGCNAGQLLVLRCATCGEVLMPPTALVCWRCLGRDLAWDRSSGRAALRSWTVVWRAPSAAFVVPYAPAVVTVEEGFDQVSAVIGCRVGDLRADMQLEVSFEPAGGGVSLPYFRPSAGRPGTGKGSNAGLGD